MTCQACVDRANSSRNQDVKATRVWMASPSVSRMRCGRSVGDLTVGYWPQCRASWVSFMGVTHITPPTPQVTIAIRTTCKPLDSVFAAPIAGVLHFCRLQYGTATPAPSILHATKRERRGWTSGLQMTLSQPSPHTTMAHHVSKPTHTHCHSLLCVPWN